MPERSDAPAAANLRESSAAESWRIERARRAESSAAARDPQSAPGLMERINHPGYGKCPGHGRHWFTLRGHVGVPLPRCARCGFPRPGEITTDDWQTLYELGWSGLTDAEREWIGDAIEYGWGDAV